MVLRVRTVALAPRSVTREHLEYPTENIHLGYLFTIGKAYVAVSDGYSHTFFSTLDIFTDKELVSAQLMKSAESRYYTGIFGRAARGDAITAVGNAYVVRIDTGQATRDPLLEKHVSGSITAIGSQAVDLSDDTVYIFGLSISGSTQQLRRYTGWSHEGLTGRTTVTSAADTTHTSGVFAVRTVIHGGPPAIADGMFGWLMPPASPGPEAKVILEVEVEGDGSFRNPYRPKLVSELLEISPDLNVPDFLKEEKKKYDILKAKGFTDEEMELLLGYKPQTHIDVASVTVGSFEFDSQSPTNIVTIFDTNPYDPRAIEKQMEMARAKNLRVFSAPEDIGLVLDIYRELSREYKHWLAGKDNFLYQVTGLEIFDILQNVDFYYGHLLEHRKGYKQLKMVPDWEIEHRLTQLEEKLTRIAELTNERDKHLAKLREIKKKGW